MASSITSFFKVITRSAVQEGKLKLIKEFAQRHGNEFSNMISLCIPTGLSWDVRVQRDSSGEIWLQDGFSKFMEDNGIGAEYLLIFKHEGKSKLSVQIFDVAATEILYNSRSVSEKSDDVIELEMDETDDDDDIDDYDDDDGDDGDDDDDGSSIYAGYDTDSDDSSFEFSGYTPRPSESASKYRENEGTSRGTTRAGRGYLTRSRRQRMEGGLVTNGRSMGEAGAANKFSRKTKQSADARDGRNNISPPETVQPRVPNSFQLLIKSHHLSKGVARLPCDFARAHKLFSTRNIKIFDSNHEWELLYDCKPNVSSYMLMKKWHHFVQDNGLAEGDICVFEAVGSGEDCKLKVNIIRRIPTQGETLPSARKPNKRRCTRCFVYGHKRANCIEIP